MTATSQTTAFMFDLHNDVKPRVERGILEWAEAEIIIPPSSEYRGLPFRARRVPWCGVVLEAMQSERFRRVAGVAPAQGGKTFTLSTLPLVHGLFERREDVIYGCPDLKMAADKWIKDILPVVQASPALRALLPKRGRGARGGAKVDSIDFAHGRSLRFMTGTGKDEARAGYTAPVVVCTEVDKYSDLTAASAESDPLSQIESRVRARRRTLVVMECTPTTSRGRIWQEITRGTDSRMLSPCPRCGAWVEPGRADLSGWQDARSDVEAREIAYWQCPECAGRLSDADRSSMQRDLRLVHRGQDVDPATGEIVGDVPETETLGVRVGGWHNLLVTTGQLGVDEWSAANGDHASPESVERKLCQHVWGLPYDPPTPSGARLTVADVAGRGTGPSRNVCPHGSTVLTAGVDVGQVSDIHWSLVAWTPGASGCVVAYGVREVPAGAPEIEVPQTLAQLIVDLSKPVQVAGGGELVVTRGFVDRGWLSHQVTATVRAAIPTGVWWPSLGRGGSKKHNYSPSGAIRAGDGWAVRKDGEGGGTHVVVDVDRWKATVHARLAAPPGAGSLVLFSAPERAHRRFAAQVVAEEQVLEWHPRHGEVRSWRVHRRDNHWLDCLAYAAAAAEERGVRNRQGGSAKAEKLDWFAERRKRRGK